MTREALPTSLGNLTAAPTPSDLSRRYGYQLDCKPRTLVRTFPKIEPMPFRLLP